MTSLYTTLGSPVPPDFCNPDWETKNRTHNWRNYVTPDLQAMWRHFTDEQKAVIAANFQQMADGEEWN